jgi:hypothetical protein
MNNCATFEICGVNFQHGKIGTTNFIINNSWSPLIIKNTSNTAFSLQGILNGGNDVISSNSFVEIAKANYSNSIKYFLQGGPTTDAKSIEIKNNTNSDQILNPNLLPIDLNILQPINIKKLTRLSSCGESKYDFNFNYIIKKPINLNPNELYLIRVKIELVGACGIPQYIEIICYFKTFESLPLPTPTSTAPSHQPQSVGSTVYDYNGEDLEILEAGDLTIEFFKEGEDSTLTSSGTDPINKIYTLSVQKGNQEVHLPGTSATVELKRDISSKILNKEFALTNKIIINDYHFLFKDILKSCKQEALLEEEGEIDPVTNKKYKYVAFSHTLSEPDGNVLGYIIYYNSLNNLNRWEIANIIAISDPEDTDAPFFKIVPFLRSLGASNPKTFPIKGWEIIQADGEYDYRFDPSFDLDFNFIPLEKEPNVEYLKFFPTSLAFDDVYNSTEHSFIENDNFSLALVLPPSITEHLDNFYAKLQVSVPDRSSEEKLVELSQIYNSNINKIVFSMKTHFPDFNIHYLSSDETILAKITLILKSNLTSVFGIDANEWIVEKEYKKTNNDFINGYKVFQIGTGLYKIIKNSKLYVITLLKKKNCDCWDLFPRNTIPTINEDLTHNHSNPKGYDFEYKAGWLDPMGYVYKTGDEKFWRGTDDDPCNCCRDAELLIKDKRCLNFDQTIKCTYCYCPPGICKSNAETCPGCCSSKECRPRLLPKHPYTVIDIEKNQGCCLDGGKLTSRIQYFQNYEQVKMHFNSNICPSKKQACANTIAEVSRYMKQYPGLYPQHLSGKYGCFSGEYTCNNGTYVSLTGGKCDDYCGWFMKDPMGSEDIELGWGRLGAGTYCLKKGTSLQGKVFDSLGGCVNAPKGALTAYACGQSVSSEEYCEGCAVGGKPCPGFKEIGPPTKVGKEYTIVSFTVPDGCLNCRA